MEKVFEIYIKTRPQILSGLKTLLESGETLETPGSQRFSDPSRG